MSRDHWAGHLIRFTANPHDIVLHSEPAYKTINTTYLLCEDDHFMPEALQRQIAEKVGATVVEIEDAGHDAFIGKSEELVDVVGEVVAKLYLFTDSEHREVGGECHSDGEGKKEEEDPMQRPLRRTTTAP
jgi:hypothetical protein